MHNPIPSIPNCEKRSKELHSKGLLPFFWKGNKSNYFMRSLTKWGHTQGTLAIERRSFHCPHIAGQ